MDFPRVEWYGAIERRRSWRRFEPRAVDAETLARLRAVCEGFRPYAEAKAVLVARPAGEVLKGLVGSYGQVKGAVAYVAMVGDEGSPHVYERVGYTGEGVVLEATSLGLATCWVGGFFRPEVAGRLLGIRKGERVLAVIPFGYPAAEGWEEALMTGFGRMHRRKPLAALVDGIGEPGWPPWVKAALDAARWAPSAVNRQPWRFTVEPDGILVSVRGSRDSYGISRRLDCGIAMLHIEVGALAHGVRGWWEALAPPQVARFRTLPA